VNATLIFSLSHYEAVAKAFISGLGKYAAAGGDLSSVASVASLFVSRMDRVFDSLLEERDEAGLVGKIAIANTRMTFLNDANIGGRYSVLSYFGLVPAALIGIDLSRLLGSSAAAACGCEACVVARDSMAVRLGAILGEMMKAGRDKVTFFVSAWLSDWGLS